MHLVITAAAMSTTLECRVAELEVLNRMHTSANTNNRDAEQQISVIFSHVHQMAPPYAALILVDAFNTL